MSERQIPTEHRFTPEYWQGHHFEDDCEWDVFKELTREEKRLQSLRDKDEKAGAKFAKDVLKDFLDLNDKTVVRRYTDGQEFNGNSVPPGTVVRFYRESLRPEPLMKEDPDSKYIGRVAYGVVYTAENFPPEESRRLSYIPEYLIEGRNFSRYFMFDQQAKIVMGEVDHRRHPKTPFGANEKQYLDKVSWLEVMKLGKGMPERETVKSRFGKLIPIFSR